MIIIDKNYQGLKSDPYISNRYYYEGDMILKENTKILINLVVKGNQTVEGNQVVKGNQIVEGNQVVKGNQTVKGYQIVEGNQEVKGNQEVEGNQVVKGNQTVEGNQVVKGNQTVKGYQIVKGNQTVEGYQTVEGKQTVLKHLTNFSLSIALEKWRISFYSDIIKIGCQVHKAGHWGKFKDDDIAKMDKDALEWWRKWKSFVMNTHSELVKVYGEVNNDR